MDSIMAQLDTILESKTFNWFVTFRDASEIWDLHPSYLMLEICLYFLSFFTFLHAVRHGGRFFYLWLATILHGLTVESLSYFMPDIDNFWHAQSMIMLLGKRLPLHIVILYPCLLYIAICAVARMHLKPWGTPFMVGLATVLLDIPFDLVGIRHLFWTWHDTDPNIFDRNYFVPWTSYYFHASFAAAFTFIFFGSRRLFTNVVGFESDGFMKEMICTVLTGILSMPLGILQFIPVYHTLHDIYHIHSEVCVLGFLAIYFLIAWVADRHPVQGVSFKKIPGSTELALIVIVHYCFYGYLAAFGEPEHIKSIGLHQPIGNCSDISDVQTASGMVLQKNTYLCASKFDEAYFDFHCLPKNQPEGNEWYTICGVPIFNHLEYTIIVFAFCFFGLVFYKEAIFGRKTVAASPTKVGNQTPIVGASGDKQTKKPVGGVAKARPKKE